MSEYPTIINAERARLFISRIQDGTSRSAVKFLIDGVQQFFSEQPSQLRSHFDLAFFTEIVEDRVEYIRSAIDGTQEAKGWWEDADFPSASPIVDPTKDVSLTGIRERQASNYIAALESRRIQSALLSLMSWVFTRQNPNAKHVGGLAVGLKRPEYAFDYLFMVMAVDYALRPGHALLQVLHGEHANPKSKGMT